MFKKKRAWEKKNKKNWIQTAAWAASSTVFSF